jgi:hypothetical protein
MAKKVDYKFTAEVNLNSEKGGAWLAVVCVCNEEGVAQAMFTTAWRNASAAKRYVKAMVQELTPRKSVKMIAGETKDEKGRPTSFSGELTYKV